MMPDAAAVRLLAGLPALVELQLPELTPDRLIKRLEESAHMPDLRISLK